MKSFPALEVLATVVDLNLFAMPRQRDVSRMPVEVLRRQHEHAVDRDALRFVHRRGIAVIKRFSVVWSPPGRGARGLMPAVACGFHGMPGRDST